VHAARGDLLARAGRSSEAVTELAEAARLAPTDQERRALTRRRDELAYVADPAARPRDPADPA
jgi:predicted RNA polymerase sigma factor